MNACTDRLSDQRAVRWGGLLHQQGACGGGRQVRRSLVIDKVPSPRGVHGVGRYEELLNH